MGSDMLSFKNHLVEADMMKAAHARVKKMKKGSEVSFTHQQTGRKVTGTHGGVKMMGGRPYLDVHTTKTDSGGVTSGLSRVPVHHIH